MKKVFASLPIAVVLLLGASLVQSCNNNQTSSQPYDSLSLKKDLTSPELSALEGIKKMHVDDGFEVKLVAEEPLVIAPVAMTFDDKGRIWALEMQDYMPDTVGTGEDEPIGKVVILSDKDGDGVMDDRKVFLDSLVLPRALAFVENGILVAEPPKLYYYDIVNDKPVNKRLVDSAYAEGGNVEHQPNGLMRALDNWIYNAKSAKRYRKKGDKWLIEKTHFRGQWGISQDDDGRLFYNTNSENLLGDYFSPGLGASNDHQRRPEGFVKRIVADNKVYPARPTPGVNRGYQPGVLDDSLRLVNFTAACGPLVYTGETFPKEYYGNVFVAEPSANLIKRNILSEEGYKINGKQAYSNKEFLASEDERFRPVNLFLGPDGAMYIVDMYRGIIQHKTYLTPYLKNEIKDRKLTKPLSAGRIYKVIPKGKPGTIVTFPQTATGLLPLLGHANNWVRNKAQQMLVDSKDTSIVNVLRNNLSSRNDLLAIHSLWTLEGLGVLQLNDLQPLLNQPNWRIKRQALSAIPSVINKQNYPQVVNALHKQMDNDSMAAPYVGYLVHYVEPYDKQTAKSLLVELSKLYANNIYVADAIISNLKDKEDAFYKESLKINPDTSVAINKKLNRILKDIKDAKKNADMRQIAEMYPKGAAIFFELCQTCHGRDGNGVPSLAPPLNHSEWVTGSKDKLIPIVLYGLTGPVKVANKVYKSPEINGDMPGIGQNKDYTDEDIAQVLSLIRNLWANKASKVTAAEVAKVRAKYKDRQTTFTTEELNSIK